MSISSDSKRLSKEIYRVDEKLFTRFVVTYSIFYFFLIGLWALSSSEKWLPMEYSLSIVIVCTIAFFIFIYIKTYGKLLKDIHYQDSFRNENLINDISKHYSLIYNNQLTYLENLKIFWNHLNDL